MACFREQGNWVLMRNHELEQAPHAGAFPAGPPPEAFDPRYVGGVSRLVLNPKSLDVVFSNMVLTGTHRNCGGGVSPWGFLSCEESRDEGHGFVFLCSPRETKVSSPQVVKSYGRFRHEAACVDPKTNYAYLTEDEHDGCFYRFRPTNADRPFAGTLEALRIQGAPTEETGEGLERGAARYVDWVTIDDPAAMTTATRHQAQKKGAALFRRGEGIWLDGEAVVFACTTGGHAGLGQLFRLDFDGDQLSLLAESEGSEDFTHPDNITVAPWGDVIVAEDTTGHAHLRGVRPNGESYRIARNIASSGEIAGVCFSPDGAVLFCNLQQDGLTLAISGPFKQLAGAGA
jgi:hypothetical protein